MTKRLSKEEFEREIAALDTLDTKVLQEKWSALHGRNPPSRIRAGLLRLGIAYRLQENALGGLKPKTIRHLRTLAAEMRAARATAETPVEGKGAHPPVGCTISYHHTRNAADAGWNGTTEVVDVVAEGLIWRGATYRTLSAVAVAITGTKWSGPKFFGLTSPQPQLRRPRMRSSTERAAEVS